MKHLNNFESFSINEQRTLATLEELCNFDSINEGFMDWIKKTRLYKKSYADTDGERFDGT